MPPCNDDGEAKGFTEVHKGAQRCTEGALLPPLNINSVCKAAGKHKSYFIFSVYLCASSVGLCVIKTGKPGGKWVTVFLVSRSLRGGTTKQLVPGSGFLVSRFKV